MNDMSTENALNSRFSGDGLAFSQFRDNHRVTVPATRVFEILSYLKSDLQFDMLAELTAVDYLEYEGATDRFGVVYVLLNTRSGERLIVACGEQALEITELQRPGGKRMPALAFLRGRSIAAGSRFA